MTLMDRFSDKHLTDIQLAHETYHYRYYVAKNKSFIYLIIVYTELEQEPDIIKVMKR